MTALLIITQKIFPHIGIQSRMAAIKAVFIRANRRGVLTIALVGLMGIGMAGYITAVVYSFNLGTALRAIATETRREEQAVKNLDVALREREANFTWRYRTVLEGMEQVSSVVYLRPDSVAFR